MTTSSSSIPICSSDVNLQQFIEAYGSPVYHSGWLIKRGHKVRNYKRRLFCLMETELKYFEGYGGLECGKISFDIKTTILCLPNFGFALIQGKFELRLYTYDNIDRLRWLHHFHRLHITITWQEIKEEEERIVYSGWLRKRGQFVKSHKRRWFVLTSTRLEYYVSPESALKGSVMMSMCGTISRLDSIKTGEPHSFQIQFPRRRLLLFADSEEELNAWLLALKSILEEKSDILGNSTSSSKCSISTNISEENKDMDIRREIQLILASPYSPEGTTSSKFLKNSASGVTLSQVQKFMTGLTEYMITNRKQALMGEWEEEVASSHIEIIVHEEVEQYIFLPLCKTIYAQIHVRVKEESKQLQDKIALLQQKNQLFFGLPPEKVSKRLWDGAIEALKEMDTVTLPHAKRRQLLVCANTIYTMYGEEHVDAESELSADDFVPILIYCVVYAKLDDPLAVKELFSIFEGSREQGEESYYVTCYQIALEYIKSLMIPSTVVFNTKIPLGISFQYNTEHRVPTIGVLELNGQAGQLIPSLKVGDVLMEVNGETVHDLTLEHVQVKLVGHSSVELSFLSLESFLNRAL